jgi:regulator of sirC expression with transglutaminase-like and TPR domain
MIYSARHPIKRLNVRPFAAGVLALMLAAPHTLADEGQLAPPEQEVKAAITQLKAIESKVESSTKLYGHTEVSTQTMRAEKAYQDAQEALRLREYRATILYLNQFLMLNQEANYEKYLKSQFQLGLAYENLGNYPRAINAYLRYIASFITHPIDKTQDMLESLQRTLHLTERGSEEQNKRFGSLLAALDTLNLAPRDKAHVTFYLAYWAAYTNRQKLADNWFESIGAVDADPRIKVKALYYDSLIHLRNRDYAKATEKLEAIVKMKAPGTADYLELTNLSLARVAVHQKKPQTALDYYDKIDKLSEIYPEALFERMILYLNLDKGELAQQDAREFLEKFPDRSEAYQVRSLLSYTALRAGGLSEAKQSIHKNEEGLKLIDNKIERDFRLESKISSAKLAKLKQLTTGWLAHPELIIKSEELFARMDGIEGRMNDVRSDIRSTIFTLGRLDLATFRPDWKNRADQLAELSLESLNIANRLMTMEREVYLSALAPREKVELDASEKRRAALSRPEITLKKESTSWPKWVYLSAESAKLAASLKKLHEQRATLQGYYLKARSNNAKKRTLERITKLIDHSYQVEAALLRATELIKARTATALLDQSFLQPIKHYLRDYAGSIYEERMITKKYHNNLTSISHRYFVEDTQNAWKIWEHVTQDIYRQMSDLHKEMTDSIQTRLAKLDGLVEQYEAMRVKQKFIISQIEDNLGRNASYLASYYGRQIDNQHGKNRKWLADIDWIEYQRQVENEQKVQEKFDLETQILREKLKDLEQGVISKW